MMVNRRLWGLMRKEFIQFARDRALVLLILYTFVEIAICGWALTLEVRNMATAVYDGDHTPESRALVDAFARYRIADALAFRQTALQALMDAGEIQFALVVPQGFARTLRRGETAQVQVLVDGSNSTIASQALAITAGMLKEYNQKVQMRHVQRAGLGGFSPLPRVENVIRIWYMPQLKYVHFIMLTMLTISVLILGILIPAAAIVREKEAGTLEQLMMTPVTSAELITAKILPMMGLKLVGLTLGVLMSMWVFGVPLKGSALLFYGISLLMFMSSSGIGVLIGTLARNMQQTLMLAFFILFPLAFLSGTVVPISNMPRVLQWFTYLSPLRYYVEVTLGIFLKGVGLDVLWPQTLALTLYGLVLLSISALYFRKRLV